jgi:regulator of sirC expression with transglutaminase-like and TPR domain
VYSPFEIERASYCRPEAYRYFLAQLPVLSTVRGLLRGAIAVSMHALDDVDPERVEQRIEVLALRVKERSPSGHPNALVANLHEVLFREEGFRGNYEHYYHALNSYLPAVLNTRRGLPILLSLIYKVVGELAGLRIEGVNAPGHFMVRVECENAWAIVDPFFGGELLTREEAFQRLERVMGRTLPRLDWLLGAPTHAQWLMRILGNLRQLFATEQRRDDFAAMTELANALAYFTKTSLPDEGNSPSSSQSA